MFYYNWCSRENLKEIFGYDVTAECDDIDAVIRELYERDRDPLYVYADHPLESAARVIAEILDFSKGRPEDVLEFYLDDDEIFHVIEDDSDRIAAIRVIMEMQDRDDARNIIFARLLYGHGRKIPEETLRKFCPDCFRPEFNDYKRAFITGRDPDDCPIFDDSPDHYELQYFLYDDMKSASVREDDGRGAGTNIDRGSAAKISGFLGRLAAAGKGESRILVIDRNADSANKDLDYLEIKDPGEKIRVLRVILEDLAENRRDVFSQALNAVLEALIA